MLLLLLLLSSVRSVEYLFLSIDYFIFFYRLCCFILLACRNPYAKPILYHIDHCTNRHCYWNDYSSPLSTPDYSPPKKSNNCDIYTTLNRDFSEKKTRVSSRWKSFRPSFTLIRVRRVFIDGTLLENDSKISCVEDTIHLQ